MSQDINEKYISQVLEQSYKFYIKAQEYDSKNETEGALINYLLALNNLNNFKEYMNSMLPPDYESIINDIFEDMDSDDNNKVTNTEFSSFLDRVQNSPANKDKLEKIEYLNKLLPPNNAAIITSTFLDLASKSIPENTSFTKEDMISSITFEFTKIANLINTQISESCGPVPEGEHENLADNISRQGYCNLKLDEVMKKILNRVVILQSRLRQIKANYLNRKTNKDDDKKDDCKIKPTVISGNKLLFEDVIGQEEAKTQLINGILNPILYPRLYPYLSKGILFWGPPGTGKTLLAKALVNELQKRSREAGEDIRILFYAPTGGELKGKYVGETEKNISKYFKCASEQAKDCELESTCHNANNIANNDNKYKRSRVISVLFIDEIEAIAGSRADDSSGIMTNSVNTLLQMMDGVASFDNVIVIGATNYPWKLDSAINRRFGTKVFLNIPGENYKEIIDLIKLHTVQYISKSLKLDMMTDDLNNGDTLLKFSKKIEEKINENQIEDNSKSNCKDDTISCYNDLICLPIVDNEKELDLKSVSELYNLYRKKFFPEFSEHKLTAYSKQLGNGNYTQGDVKNIMRSIYRIMGERAINQPTELMTVYIGGNNENNLKDNLNIYNHQAIDYLRPTPDFNGSAFKKQFTFNYYEPCGSELPSNMSAGVNGDDLLLFTTDAYSKLTASIIDGKQYIIDLINTLRKNFVNNIDSTRYSDMIKKLSLNQFKYISHFVTAINCPDIPDINKCGDTVMFENDSNGRLSIDYLNESLHLYVRENLVGNIFRKHYIPFISQSYFGLKLAKKSQVPNRAVELLKNYKNIGEMSSKYLFTNGNEQISIINDVGGSIPWSDVNGNIIYVLLRKNSHSNKLKINTDINIKYFQKNASELEANKILAITDSPKLNVLINNTEEEKEFKKFILVKLNTALNYNKIINDDITKVRLKFYDENKDDDLQLAKCDIVDAHIKLNNTTKLWGGEFNKFLPQASYDSNNKIGYLVLYWLGYDLNKIEVNKEDNKIIFNDNDVKTFIDSLINRLKSTNLNIGQECIDLKIPQDATHNQYYDIAFTNLVVYARRNYLNYIFKSLKIVYNNVITVTSFIHQPSIIGKYILLNDVITQLISLDLNHILKKRLLLQKKYTENVFMDKLTTIRGIFHQKNTLMLPMDLNEKYNINYDGEVYLRYSLSSQVNDYNPITYDSRNEAIRIKNKNTWENWGDEDWAKGLKWEPNTGIWRPYYASSAAIKYVISIPWKIKAGYFNTVTNNQIKNTREEEKLASEGKDNFKNVGFGTGLGALGGLGLAFFGPVGWSLAALGIAGGAAAGGVATYWYNHRQNQDVLKLLKDENLDVSTTIEKLTEHQVNVDKAENDLLKNIENNPNLAILYEMENKKLEQNSYIYESFYNCIDGIICADQQSRISTINNCVEEVIHRENDIEKIQKYLKSIYPSDMELTQENLGNYNTDHDFFRCNEFYLPNINCVETDCSKYTNSKIRSNILIKRALSNSILLQDMFLNYNSQLIKHGLYDITLHFRKYINRSGNKITEYLKQDTANQGITAVDGEDVEGHVDGENVEGHVGGDGDEDEDEVQVEDVNPQNTANTTTINLTETIDANNQLNLYGSTNAIQAYFFKYDRYNYSINNTLKPNDESKGFYIQSDFAPPSYISTYDILTFINKKPDGTPESRRTDDEVKHVNEYTYPGNKKYQIEYQKVDTPNSFTSHIPHRPYLFCNTCKVHNEDYQLQVLKGGAQCDTLMDNIAENDEILEQSFKMNDNSRFVNFKFNPEDFQYAVNPIKNLAAVRPSTSKEHIDIMKKYQQNSDSVTKEELKKIK